MSTTTSSAILDTMLSVVEALTPTSLPGDKFRRYRNEGAGNFEDWAEAEPASAFRRFQIRDTGAEDPPLVSDTTTAETLRTFTALVAYPHNSRTGPKNALDRDRVMTEDQHQIESAIGLFGGANFADASWRSGHASRVAGTACDFLEITVEMAFYRAVPTP